MYDPSERLVGEEAQEWEREDDDIFWIEELENDEEGEDVESV